jgi:hypothetical protein
VSALGYDGMKFWCCVLCYCWSLALDGINEMIDRSPALVGVAERIDCASGQAPSQFVRYWARWVVHTSGLS